MKIDKTRFLMLTGALSAVTVAAVSGMTGCTVVSNSTDAGAGDASVTPSTDAATDGGGGADGATDGSAGDAGADASACLDDNGTVADCGDAGSCSCNTTSGLFKKGVANAIAECQLKLPTCEGEPAADACITDAIAKACDDATVTAYCTPLVNDCANGVGQKITQKACEDFAKALSTDGRTQLTSCITEGVANGCSTDSLLCAQP